VVDIGAAKDVVPVVETQIEVELASEHAPKPAHQLQFGRDLVMNQVVVQLPISGLEQLMVNSVALLDDDALLLFGFESLLEAFAEDLLLLVGVVLLGVGGRVQVELRTDFSFEGGHVFGDLVQVLDAQLHYSIEAPVDICECVAAVEHELAQSLWTAANFSQVFHAPVVTVHRRAVRASGFSEKCDDEDGEHLVHALAVTEVGVVLGPQVKQVFEGAFDFLAGEENIFLHGSVHVLSDQFSQLPVAAHLLLVCVQLLGARFLVCVPPQLNQGF